jgi:methylated-DNA-[protein]-cysteine S-methyltransferase
MELLRMSASREIPQPIKYTVFRTKWGYFGLAGTDKGLLRTCLPLAKAEDVRCLLLTDIPDTRCEEALFQGLQRQITAYFEGSYVVFNNDIQILLEGKRPFAQKVLSACHDVSFGRTITYGELARKTCRPKAARAVGRVMAQNPLPLIIPCHRVVRTDGRIGGFSAAGGVAVKKRMLELERRVVTHGSILETR